MHFQSFDIRKLLLPDQYVHSKIHRHDNISNDI